MRPIYIHERDGWPRLRWDEAGLARPLGIVRHAQGRLLGQMEALGVAQREEASVRILTEDALRTSAIEGETLDADQVRSSLARRMGLATAGLPPPSREVDGLVEMMLDATRQAGAALTEERLLGWHAALFPVGGSPLVRITSGAWRTAASGPMRVVSGAYGHERVHFEAPSHDRVAGEIRGFLDWFNAPLVVDPVIASALAHFWFVTIHPFEDGNGRIARAIADLQLARADGTHQRFYSMSAQIQWERTAYYDVLERSQRGSLDVTAWLEWYLACLQRAIAGSGALLTGVLAEARFWREYQAVSFNERQRRMLHWLLAGPEASLTSSRWAKVTECSADTALRDITELLAREVLVRDATGGRSTRYRLRAGSGG
jgi:Fic family protein